MQVSSKITNKGNTSGSRPVSIFLNTSICLLSCPLPEKLFLVSHAYEAHTRNVCYTLRGEAIWLAYVLKKTVPTDQSQELVYLNEVLKTMLAGSTTLFLPSFHAVFVQSFFICFFHYLGAWKRLNNRMENIKAFWILDRKITMHSICFSCCTWPRKSVHQNVDNATIDFHWMKQDFTIKLRY